MSIASPLLRPLGGNRSTSTILIDGESLAVNLRRNSQARRLILRLDKTGDAVSVTVPDFASFQAAMEFAARQANWIQKQRAKRKPTQPFADGGMLPLRGHDHVIVHRPQSRGTVWLDPDSAQVHVAGKPEHLARRLKDWLKAAARTDLETACHSYANVMNLSYSRLTVRDQTSRWGSCSASGTLSFSWRLILAPPFVLDYVAAHEVAHLRQMNHGPKFWTLVESHCPRTTTARNWLKKHGHSLHRYGR